VAIALAGRLGFDEPGCGKAALVVTEAATNLVKHARAGELLLHTAEQDRIGGLEILALDRGPGMADLSRCLRDGFSTAGSAGTGLGAIVRLSDFFDIHTVVPSGTAVLARLWSQPVPADAPAAMLEIGTVHLPKPKEEVCGDGWAVHQQAARSMILVADGLGHGPVAAEAAREAVRIFRENNGLSLVEMVQYIHAALRSTRGAAVALAEVNLDARELRFAGVGNIAGTIFASATSRSMVSHNGTVGHQVRKVQEFVYPFPRGALLVMHSDGLATHWRLEQYAGLAARHPSLIAGVLYRDFRRDRDDVTVVAARAAAEGAE
jgi:anti-sigma regulatory factor (Ser/Thr protein kinase)